MADETQTLPQQQAGWPPGTSSPRPFEDTDAPAGWETRRIGESATGGLPLNSRSVAYESVRVVKGGPGTLYGFTVYNSNAAAQFILVFDFDGAGQLSSSSIPSVIFSVPGASSFSIYWGLAGRAFTRGCIIANSSTGPTYTAGSADCWIDAQYV